MDLLEPRQPSSYRPFQGQCHRLNLDEGSSFGVGVAAAPPPDELHSDGLLSLLESTPGPLDDADLSLIDDGLGGADQDFDPLATEDPANLSLDHEGKAEKLRVVENMRDVVASWCMRLASNRFEGDDNARKLAVDMDNLILDMTLKISMLGARATSMQGMDADMQHFTFVFGKTKAVAKTFLPDICQDDDTDEEDVVMKVTDDKVIARRSCYEGGCFICMCPCMCVYVCFLLC